MLSVSGSYVGNGLTTQSITGIPFQPDIVIVKDVGNTYDTWFRTKDMAANYSLPVRSDAVGDSVHVQSLDTGGFTVGNSINVNGSAHAYVYLAMKDNGAGDFSTVTYTGNAGNDFNVFSTFQPTFTMLKSNSSIVGAEKFAGQPSALATVTSNDASMQYQSSADRHSLIGFLSGAMYVSQGNGVGNLVNVNAIAHYGFVLKDVSGLIQTGSYTGTGSSQTINTTFQPIWINIHSASSFPPVMQYSTQMAGGNTNPWDGSQTTGKISGANSTGFTVSTDTSVNNTGSTYWYTAIGAGGSGGSTRLMMGV